MPTSKVFTLPQVDFTGDLEECQSDFEGCVRQTTGLFEVCGLSPPGEPLHHRSKPFGSQKACLHRESTVLFWVLRYRW
jgi:hypothetical protein